MKIEPARGPWSYDLATEELRDVNGNKIGSVEPASGVIAAAGCELFALCVNLVKHYDTEFLHTAAVRNLPMHVAVGDIYDALQRLDAEWTKIEEKSKEHL